MSKIKGLEYDISKQLVIDVLNTNLMNSTEKGQFFTDLVLNLTRQAQLSIIENEEENKLNQLFEEIDNEMTDQDVNSSQILKYILEWLINLSARVSAFDDYFIEMLSQNTETPNHIDLSKAAKRRFDLSFYK